MSATSPLEATAAADAAPSATTTAAGRTSLFSSAASPALILAFLAIGIFAGGMLCLSLMKRFGLRNGNRARRDAAARREMSVRQWIARVGQDTPARARGPNAVQAGVKPTLWEVGSTPLSGEGHDIRWTGVNPVALSYTRPPPSTDQPHSLPDSSPPTRQSPSRGLTHWFTDIPSLLPLRKPPPPPRPAQLQLAVAVAMPSPRGRSSHVPVYELGLAKVKWDSEKLDSVTEATPPEPPALRGL